jgi:DNA repair exonuclease SbcCD ATPase subunit
MRTKRSDATSMEVDKLRAYLTAMQQEVSTLREKATRAELAEAKVRVEMATTTMPLEVHEQAVRVARKEITEARAQTAEVTSKLKEKEAMLMAVQKELMAEGESLVAKVRELSGELTKRVTAEDMEAAIKRAVKEVELELENALENGLALSHELEEKERQIVQLQEEWHLERSNLCAELASVRKSLATVEEERVSEKEQLQETQQKVHILEKKLSEVYQSMNDAEEERLKKQQAVLSTVRSLVLDMGRNKGISLSSDSQDGCEYSVSTIFSEEKVAALEKFFAILRVLIKQESQKMDTFAFALQQVLLNDRFSGETMTRDSKIKGANEEESASSAMKPTITLCYETSWESAYLHYCADSTQWTDLPGILMQNQSAADGRPFKVLHVSGSSLEFVLTDGNGSWDCPPAGGNYYIQNSGTFLLSSGVIQQGG